MVFESTFFSRKISACAFSFSFFFCFVRDPAHRRRGKRSRGEGGRSLKKTGDLSLSPRTERKGTRGHDTNREEKKNKGPQRRIIEGRRKEKQSRPRRHFSSVVYIYITYIYIFTRELKHTKDPHVILCQFVSRSAFRSRSKQSRFLREKNSIEESKSIRHSRNLCFYGAQTA